MLSIITINLNNINGLKETIFSILGQKNKNFELIFIDGGSNDGSLDFISSIIDILKIKKIIGSDNGIYNAMNIAIPLIEGDSAIFLNSGDYFDSIYSTDIIIGDEISGGNYVNLYSSKIYGKIKTPKYIYCKYWSLPTSHQSIVYSKNVLTEYSYDERYKYSADFDHFIRISHDRSIIINRFKDIISVNREYGSIKNLSQIKIEYYKIVSKYLPHYISYLIVVFRFMALKLKGFQ